jgi:hypothetical protein
MLYPFTGPLGSAESWGMFTLTGNPAYYMLYKNITGESEKREEDEQRR